MENRVFMEDIFLITLNKLKLAITNYNKIHDCMILLHIYVENNTQQKHRQ